MCNIGAWSNRGFTCKSGNFTFPVLPVLTCSTKVLKTSRKYFVFSSSGLIIWQKGKPKRVYSLCFEYSLYFLETADVSFKIALLSCFDWQLTISQGLFNRWLAFRQACYHPTTLFSCWSFFVFRETNGRGGGTCVFCFFSLPQDQSGSFVFADRATHTEKCFSPAAEWREQVRAHNTAAVENNKVALLSDTLMHLLPLPSLDGFWNTVWTFHPSSFSPHFPSRVFTVHHQF